MPELSGLLLVTVVLALLFDFSNGWHDCANAVATVVSTRVLRPLTAVLLAGALNVAGAFFSTVDDSKRVLLELLPLAWLRTYRRTMQWLFRRRAA